jgi:hypothetical protein
VLVCERLEPDSLTGQHEAYPVAVFEVRFTFDWVTAILAGGLFRLLDGN